MNSNDSSSDSSGKNDERGAFMPAVIDYYKNHSQSKKLSTYFRGDAKILNENLNRPPLIGQSKSPEPPCVIIEPPEAQVIEQARAPSPASSVASNRKLEWDNGADIGYDNYQAHKTLQKSLSLPVLSAHGSGDLRFSPEGQKIESDSNIKTSSTNESSDDLIGARDDDFEAKSESNAQSEVKSASESDLERVATVLQKSQKSYRKIGAPIANSTPICENARERFTKQEFLPKKSSDTSENSFKKSSACVDVTLKPKSNQIKPICLCITKPITVECISDKPIENKQIQTTLTKNTSAAVQTDRIVPEIETVATQNSPKSAVLYIEHSSSEKGNDFQSSSNSDNPISKCNSFEYLSGDGFANAKSNDKESEKSSLESKKSVSVKSIPLSKKSTSESEKSVPESDLPLGQLIAQKQSNHLINDIEKSVNLIQKLANSKRYDDVTKKYYMKKIVEKIVRNCYSGDNSDTSSSKKENDKENVLKSRNKEEEKYLHDNLPWKPPETTESRRLDFKTFVDQILPENQQIQSTESYETTSSSDKRQKLPKRSRFTLSSKPCNLCYPISNSTTLTSSSKNSDWRTEKTQSEKLLEQQKLALSESGDHVVSFAKKERENQILWIDNEISHLSKLKRLLEKEKQSKSKIVESVLCRPQIDELPGVKKSTTVYMITTERSGSSNSGRSTAGSSGCCRCIRNAEKDKLEEKKSTTNNSNPQKCNCVQRYVVASNVQGLKRGVQYNFQVFNPDDIIEQTPKTNSNNPCCPCKSAGSTKAAICRYTFDIPLTHCRNQEVTDSASDNKNKTSESNNAHKSCDCKNVDCKCSSTQTDVDRDKGFANFGVHTKEGVEKDNKGVITDKDKFASADDEGKAKDGETAKINSLNKCRRVSNASAGCKIDCMQNVKERDRRFTDASVMSVAEDARKETQTEKEKVDKCEGIPKEREKRFSDASVMSIADDAWKETQTDKEKFDKCVGCPKEREKRFSDVSVMSTCTLEEARKGVQTDNQDGSLENQRRDSQVSKDIGVGDREGDKYASKSSMNNLLKRSEETISPKDKDSISKTSDKSSLTEKQPTNKSIEIEKTPSTSSSSTLTSTSSSSSNENFPTLLCPCCKRNPISVPSEISLGVQSRNQPNHVLCHPCYMGSGHVRSFGSRPYYTHPGHVCSCYTYVKTSAVQQIRDTVRELSDLDQCEEFCKCYYGISEKNGRYCSRCKCKLKRDKKGVAYLLTFEKEGVKEREKERRKKERKLEEVKVKIPVIVEGKKEKRRKKGKEEEKDHGKESRRKKQIKLTLQEYLCVNKPGFVQSAEERRRNLIELAYMREQRCQKYKQLLALTGAVPLKNHAENFTQPKHVFTTKEMKELTARHYKKLPEVQQKLVDNREKQLKQANRLMADIFNKKIRENALKGKVNLSTSASVINFV